MKLQVKNFGPIREAEVELKPLTVLVGPSNTGKSYLAMLLYSITKTLDKAGPRMAGVVHNYFSAELRGAPENASAASIYNDSGAFAPIVAGAMSLFAQSFRDAWFKEANRCFGEEWETLVNNKKISVVITSQDGVVWDLFNPEQNKFPDAEETARHIQGEIQSAKSEEQHEMGHTDYWMDDTNLEDVCASAILHTLWFLPVNTSPFADAVHYLPAVRGGIMQNHQMLVNAIVENAPTISISDQWKGTPFSGVLVDFLQKLLNVGRNGKAAADYRHQRRYHTPIKRADELSGKMEKEILGGQILVNLSETGYPNFRYRFGAPNKRADMSLMNASSSVSELAPITLFIRHYLSSGNIFIVEEPEAHLHPAAQRQMADVLAGIVNDGVYVVVTTHSDMILEQLSNFVHAHGVPKVNLLNEESGERTIDEDKTAVYSFADSSRNEETVVRKIKFNEDTGMVTEDHLDASSAMYDETVHIFKRKQRMSNDA